MPTASALQICSLLTRRPVKGRLSSLRSTNQSENWDKVPDSRFPFDSLFPSIRSPSNCFPHRSPFPVEFVKVTDSR